MISAAYPGFLIAAGVLAAVPIALHFLSRRPPARAALPTARFLTEDPRTLLRLQRTPTDALLLAVRVTFALALAAAFAGLTWMPDRSGAVRVVLVDAGMDPAVPWSDAVDAVREVAGGGGGGRPITLIVYGLDEGSRVVDVGELDGLDLDGVDPGEVDLGGLDELERGAVPATVEDGLRALRDAARAGRFAEAEVTWVGRTSWRAWSPGLGLMREELWPGGIVLRTVGTRVSAETGEDMGEDTDVSAETPAGAPPPPVVFLTGTTADGPLRRAVEAIGGQVATNVPEPSGAGAPDGLATPHWIFAESPSATGLELLLDQARAGATVILGGPVPEPASEPETASEPEGPSGPAPSALPWVVDPTVAAGSADRLVLAADRAIGAPVARLPGRPSRGARTLATFADAAPAAAAQPLGEGCVVYLAASLSAPELTASPDYPALIQALAHGCGETNRADPADPADGPLDTGALRAIERSDLPTTVDVASLVAAEGYPLTRWLILLALGLLGLEVAMTRGRGARARSVAHEPGG